MNSPHVISEHIDGETVMINLQTGSYYNLNASGAHIWALLPRDRGVMSDEVVRLLSHQQVQAPHLADEVAAFLRQLLAEQLVVPVDTAESPSGAPPESGVTAEPLGSQPWEAPTLTRFDDMQDLLLLDPVHEVDERGWPHVPSDNGT